MPDHQKENGIIREVGRGVLDALRLSGKFPQFFGRVLERRLIRCKKERVRLRQGEGLSSGGPRQSGRGQPTGVVRV